MAGDAGNWVWKECASKALESKWWVPMVLHVDGRHGA